jgi:hypothetical protein
MSFAVKFQLFHRRQWIVNDAVPMRNMTVFLHPRVERTAQWDWMCVF